MAIEDIPSGKLTVCDIENGHRKFVDLPTNSIVIFHSYVSLPEGKLIYKLINIINYIYIYHKP